MRAHEWESRREGFRMGCALGGGLGFFGGIAFASVFIILILTWGR